ncbi:MAG: hypothetical protein ACOC1K_03115 [Nanoarchaeota archaeon]
MNKNEYYKYLKSRDWQIKRSMVFAAYGRKCESCGKSNNLHVHHLRYKNIYDCTVRDFTVLCKDCHKIIHRIYKTKIVAGLKIKINYDRTSTIRMLKSEINFRCNSQFKTAGEFLKYQKNLHTQKQRDKQAARRKKRETKRKKKMKSKFINPRLTDEEKLKQIQDLEKEAKLRWGL